MAARDHLQGAQLSMFMPAYELYGMHSMDTASYSDVDQMRRIKRNTMRHGSLPSHVAQHGVQTPVQVFHGDQGEPNIALYMQGHEAAVANGNHRLIAQYDANPRAEVPVVHHDDFGDLSKSTRQQDAIKWRG